jgi:DNA primase small subunit
VGIEAELHSLERTQETPATAEIGWNSRLTRALYSFFLDTEPERLQELGIGKQTAQSLLEKKEEILESLSKGTISRMLRLFNSKDRQALDKLVGEAVKREAADVDTVVTADIHRLIRLPMTFHGKTGLKAEKLQVNALEGFDPLRGAVAFNKGEITAHISSAPEFRMGDETFGPFADERVKLPVAAAILLLCKGAARVVV